VGDPSPLQADTNVARVAQDAIWQALAQNSRRETNWLGSDIVILVGWVSASGLGQDQGHAEMARFCKSEAPWRASADHKLGGWIQIL
jgi:hypothetical protein